MPDPTTLPSTSPAAVPEPSRGAWWQTAQRALRYGWAITRHIASGMKPATPDEIAQRLLICQRCPSGQFTGAACNACGCSVSQSANVFANKAAMRSENCPKGHWPSLDPTTVVPPRLTVGMAVYDDFANLWHTLRSLDLHHPEWRGRAEWLVIDNHPVFPDRDQDPHSPRTCSERARDLCAHVPGAVYVPYGDIQGTSAPRDLVFRKARGEITICIDSHVLLPPGALTKTVEWLDANPAFNGLFQGPMLYDDNTPVTHMEPVWRDRMYGTWAVADHYHGPETPPFHIPLMGLGLFGCRRHDWLGFSPHFREFGGEEGYIHEKYRQANRPVICLPWLEWAHQFADPHRHAHYPSSIRARFRNYLVGWHELGLDLQPVIDHFCGDSVAASPQFAGDVAALLEEVAALE